MASDFFVQVHEVARLIPKGRVTSYGAIAAYLGTKQASRTIGYAMNAAHIMQDIPAHRVVNRLGCLTGKTHFAHPDEMQQLLEAEGHKIVEDQIQDFDKVFWDPSIELT
jgi:methylated-DNA-protein-cysteine methyltransferase related protein